MLKAEHELPGKRLQISSCEHELQLNRWSGFHSLSGLEKEPEIRLTEPSWSVYWHIAIRLNLGPYETGCVLAMCVLQVLGTL